MFILRDIKLKINHSDDALRAKVNEACGLNILRKKGLKTEPHISIIKKSIDARKKPEIYYIYTVKLDFGADEPRVIKNIRSMKKGQDKFVFDIPKAYEIPECGDKGLTKPPVIIGSGPCGMFAAYILAQKGFRPIVIERGENVDDRQKTIESYWNGSPLQAESNVQFGEGGAGTFSDGKLNTLTKDINGRNTYVINTFHRFGASKKITIDAKPHIGTDVLRRVVKNMREKIIALGGQFMFDTRLVDISIAESDNEKRVSGITLFHNKSGVTFEIDTDLVLLAIGHSARDTFELLYKKGLDMETKSFAVGFRVRHPQSDVDMWQLGVEDAHRIGLEAADYKVTNEASNGRRVYSFCMCPGGYVVNSSSEKGQICVNGMSEEKRDSGYANSAIIAGIDPEDFDQKVVTKSHPLSGMYYQRDIEAKAFLRGEGAVPVQLFSDFEENTVSSDDILNLNGSCLDGVKGQVKSASLRGIFSDSIDEAIIESMHKFSYTRKGFAGDALMLGIEARTSSPVRILRDDSFESNIKGIIPCGEGAGYAGGITSAATDGIKSAEKIIMRYRPDYPYNKKNDESNPMIDFMIAEALFGEF